MDEHKKFLADRLLSEERPITYRLLSRALDVHVNTAKRMLYDFHQYQNSLRAESIHATYLLYGIKSARSGHENGDVGMSSSMPEPEPRSESVSTQTLTLVREENLEALLREYQEVTSIHIYSLAPRAQTDVALLADVANSISETYKQDGSPLATSKYGVIPNPSVRRRDPAGRLAPPTVSASKPVKQEKAPEKPAPAAKAKHEPAEKSSANATPSSSSGKGAAPSTKRGSAGGIMQSFAKAASKPPSKPKQATKEEASAAALSDDGEADDSDMPSSKKASTAPGATRESRKEREENLRRMMDDDDGEDVDDKDDEPDDEEMDDAPEPEAEPEQMEPETKPKEEPAEVISSSGNGRRRGKRRIMKKKRILDDQGYMVTIQEPGWESFSEDDTPQPPAKKATPTSTPSSSGAKTKKPGGKKDQGNIMSFFSKK
ncbi:DNA polymerase subunit cdc27 domain-containing protein [Hirsutella rhossiliensis]|uniref:DNA polymerase delta subunit 3 n=1 Tax=Hirsutella rhossiliensis TaxID=111463 RepID=A0A9P8MSA6_9HYPO|nr:DNA polymerase subunit cdc27 domain-containing protein [Hirsutella rhossiliensis]KAH0960300.1 DNA polymerase subunit cdc27 domain-containing protein [Hirsutella rhossiliensis]